MNRSRLGIVLWATSIEAVLLGALTLFAVLVFFVQWVSGRWVDGDWPAVALSVVLAGLAMTLFAYVTPTGERTLWSLVLVTAVGACAMLLNLLGLNLPMLLGAE